jgi:hypothetical protein
MLELTNIYNAFDSDLPLPADDDARYVDLSPVRGQSKTARKLVQKILNAPNKASHHLLMGHTKCGKTTELLRTQRFLEEKGYATVFFDVADIASRTFEYTTVLLLMAGQVVEQLAARNPPIEVKGATAQKLAEFLLEKEITRGQEFKGEATGKLEAKVAPALLTRLLGHFGLGLELRGGFGRSREITLKIEADTKGFLSAVRTLLEDAYTRTSEEGFKGLVIICDGCDKLSLSATDEAGKSMDLQRAMFVDHAPDLRSVPCHVIYTVPISISVNLGDIWEQMPEFLPAIPVNRLAGVADEYPTAGRAALTQVVQKRLAQQNASCGQLFADAGLLEQLITYSGGHISDLILLVRQAVLEAQTDGAATVSGDHVKLSIRSRAQEYQRLVESEYLPILASIDQSKTAPSVSDEYREIMFKRLALEYWIGDENKVDLHPLVAASDAYTRWRKPLIG